MCCTFWISCLPRQSQSSLNVWLDWIRGRTKKCFSFAIDRCRFSLKSSWIEWSCKIKDNFSRALSLSLSLLCNNLKFVKVNLITQLWGQTVKNDVLKRARECNLVQFEQNQQRQQRRRRRKRCAAHLGKLQKYVLCVLARFNQVLHQLSRTQGSLKHWRVSHNHPAAYLSRTML